MAASSSSALKARIEALGLGIAAYRDRAPKGAARPYVTITEGVSRVPDESGDNGTDPTIRELAQVSLWEDDRSTANLKVESFTLAADLTRGLHGAQLASVGSAHVYGCRVRNSVRLVEDDGTVQTAITVEIARQL